MGTVFSLRLAASKNPRDAGWFPSIGSTTASDNTWSVRLPDYVWCDELSPDLPSFLLFPTFLWNKVSRLSFLFADRSFPERFPWACRSCDWIRYCTCTYVLKYCTTCYWLYLLRLGKVRATLSFHHSLVASTFWAVIFEHVFCDSSCSTCSLASTNIERFLELMIRGILCAWLTVIRSRGQFLCLSSSAILWMRVYNFVLLFENALLRLIASRVELDRFITRLM